MNASPLRTLRRPGVRGQSHGITYFGSYVRGGGKICGSVKVCETAFRLMMSVLLATRARRPRRDERDGGQATCQAEGAYAPPSPTHPLLRPFPTEPGAPPRTMPFSREGKQLHCEQQRPFWPKWDELPAMLDALASPTLTNRSHFGQLFPPNLALRRFANICKV